MRRKMTPVIFAGLLIVAFFTGVYHQQVTGFVASLFGVRSYSGTLPTDQIQEVYQKLKANYDGTLDDQTLLDGALHGLVEAADDAYTVYMNQDEVKEFEQALTGSIGGGIGAEIGLRNERVSIVRVLSNTPAEASGVQNGDTILKINDDITEGWTVDDAVKKIRGEIGTTVKLTIERNGVEKVITITRAEITTPSVESEVKDGVGIITVTRFDADTAELVRQAATVLTKEDIKGVVLDLRGNGGGYLEAAQGVAGVWLSDKVVVQERRGDEVIDTLRTSKNPVLENMKTVVLIDEYSASASEIVAGALQEHGAATLVGVTSFGKGTVQQLITLSNGSQLKVTIARWYTPNGKNITEEGITPDVEATISDKDIAAKNDTQMTRALQLINK